MPDFHQTRRLASYHDLGAFGAEREIDAPEMSLILPAHGPDLRRLAKGAILRELPRLSGLGRVVLALNRLDEAQYAQAKRLAESLPVPTSVLWTDGPGLMRWRQEQGIDAAPGKGANVWHGLGWLWATGAEGVVAVQDADILRYRSRLLRRLCLPLGPLVGHDFSKGYYARHGQVLHGRLQRLFFTPLLWALEDVFGPSELLGFLGEFRYPLAGECAFRLDWASRRALESGWGLEVGMLCELASEPEKASQIDLGLNYEHKHQPVESLAAGLREIAAALYARLQEQGAEYSPKALVEVEAGFARHCQRLLPRYEREALVNGLEFPREEESRAASLFLAGLASFHQQGCPCVARLPAWRGLLGDERSRKAYLRAAEAASPPAPRRKGSTDLE